jgi:hypothetical protein
VRAYTDLNLVAAGIVVIPNGSPRIAIFATGSFQGRPKTTTLYDRSGDRITLNELPCRIGGTQPHENGFEMGY